MKLLGPIGSDGARRLAKFRAGPSDFSRFAPQGYRVLPRAQYSAQICLVMGDLLEQRDEGGTMGLPGRERHERTVSHDGAYGFSAVIEALAGPR